MDVRAKNHVRPHQRVRFPFGPWASGRRVQASVLLDSLELLLLQNSLQGGKTGVTDLDVGIAWNTAHLDPLLSAGSASKCRFQSFFPSFPFSGCLSAGFALLSDGLVA